MDGEFILNLLIKEGALIKFGHNWLICHGDIIKLYTVYQRKPSQRKTRTLIESTKNEELACKILKES